MLNPSVLTWTVGPTVLGVLLLVPILALTTLVVLAACIALFGPKDRRRTAIQLLETVLDGLLCLISRGPRR